MANEPVSNEPVSKEAKPSPIGQALGVVIIVIGVVLLGLVTGAGLLAGLGHSLRATEEARQQCVLTLIDALLLVFAGWRCAWHGASVWRCCFALVFLLAGGASVATWIVRFELPIVRSDAALRATMHITTAESVYRDGGTPPRLEYGTLRDLANAKLIDEELGTGRGPGYTYTVTLSTTRPDFYVVATPDGGRGQYYFRNGHGGLMLGCEPPRVNPETYEPDNFRLPLGD